MKRVLYFLAIVAFAWAGCDKGDSNLADSEFTGKQVTYSLYSGSPYNVYGIATILERKDGSATVRLTVSGTSSFGKSTNQFPVHLHLGDVSTSNAPVAALLNPVDPGTGKSETVLTKLGDDTPVTFEDLEQMTACIKIHLAAAGPESSVVLAGGNIGTAVDKSGNSRVAPQIAVCGSN